MNIKKEEDRRIYNIKVRLSLNEKAFFFEKMLAESTKNISVFLRNCALNRLHKVKQKDLNTIALISAFKQFNNNFNQSIDALEKSDLSPGQGTGEWRTYATEEEW